MEHIEQIPKQLYENRNSSDIFDREIIAAILRIFNKKIVYQQIWDELTNKTEKITVPFFYNFGGNNSNSEKFIQDNYLFFGDNECTEIGLKKIDGNFDFYPRGELTLSSDTIDSGNITNRFVLGKFYKKEGDELKPYVSQLYSIPLTYNFNIEIKATTLTEVMKIKQAYREYFYKNKTTHINYRGLVVPVRIGFTEALTSETSQSYTMGGTDQKQYLSLTFSITVESYQPVFDPTTEMLADNTINNFGLGIGIEGNLAKTPERSIYTLNDISNSTIVSGTNVLLQWSYSFQYADLLNVEISYIDLSNNNEVIIDNVQNNNFYYWKIPEELGCITTIDLIIPNTDEVNVYQQPNIKIVPNLKTKIVSIDNISLINKGYFITDKNQIDGVISYMKLNKELEEIPVKINLLNNMINPEHPLEFEDFVYKNKISPLKINLLIKDSYHKETYFQMNNISII